MHSYLRAIGFSNIKKKKDLDSLINFAIINQDNKEMAEIEEDSLLTEISKEFTKSVGINICGEYNEENEFSTNYYYPYLRGKGITSNEDVSVEKHAEKESYAGIVDDVKVGVSLIFYLQNVTEYLNEKRIGALSKQNISITLSALSTNGMIILPISKNETQIKNTKEASINRNTLIAAARNGDEDAIESLTLEDIDTYTMISKRILNEDVFTIVDSYFMPYGIECDQYSVLGEITDYEVEVNSYTKEEVYIITLNTNALTFDICINKKDLMGEPEIGRRFKGVIWMQGRINFPI